MDSPIIFGGGKDVQAMDEMVASQLANSGYTMTSMGAAPPRPAGKRNPIIAIYAMNDYVVYEREWPDQKTQLKRTPVQRREALVRMMHVLEGLFKDTCGKPKDEILYDEWLVEMTIKAAAESAILMGRPYRSRDVEAKLQQLKIAVAGIRDRGE